MGHPESPGTCVVVLDIPYGIKFNPLLHQAPAPLAGKAPGHILSIHPLPCSEVIAAPRIHPPTMTMPPSVLRYGESIANETKLEGFYIPVSFQILQPHNEVHD